MEEGERSASDRSGDDEFGDRGIEAYVECGIVDRHGYDGSEGVDCTTEAACRKFFLVAQREGGGANGDAFHHTDRQMDWIDD